AHYFCQLANDRHLAVCKTGDVAARTCQAVNKSVADRIGHPGKYNRYGPGRLLQFRNDKGIVAKEQVGVERNQLCRKRPSPAGIAPSKAHIDSQVAPAGPSQTRQCAFEFREGGLPLRIILTAADQSADPPHALALLRPRRQRPRRSRGAEEREEGAAVNG